MAAVTMTLGGTSLPAPSDWTSDLAFLGSQMRGDGGTLLTDEIAYKWKHTVNWQRLSATDLATLYNAWTSKRLATNTLVLPDNSSLSVVSAADGWRQTPRWYQSSNTFRYDVTIVFQEA